MPHVLSFKAAWLHLFLFFVFAVFAKFLSTALGGDGIWMSLGVLAVVGFVWILLLGRSLFQIIHTPYFSTSCLLFIALGTAIGTFVLFSALSFDNVFHSWWYVGLYGLLGISLVRTSFIRPFTKTSFFFYAAHLSPVIVLAGFWMDYFYGYRGIIGLEVGSESSTVRVYEGNTNRVMGQVELPFNVRLNAFSSEKFDPDYRIQVWKGKPPSANPHGGMDTESMNQLPELLTTVALEPGKVHKIYGTDFYYRLGEFFPNFHFTYDYPEVTDTIEPADPGIMIQLNIPAGTPQVQLRANQNSSLFEPHLNAMMEFHWELPDDLESLNLSEEWDPTDTLRRVVFAGLDEQVYYVGDKGVQRVSLERSTDYKIPGKSGMSFLYQFIFPDAKFMSANPASMNDELLNPVARLEVWEKDWTAYEYAYVYPSQGSSSGFYFVPSGNYMLGLNSFRDMQVKYWRSNLSLIGADGASLKTKDVEVNEPVSYNGYKFYQTDYDEQNPNYSGIGVSYNPGLGVVYAGFIILFFSSLFLMFIRENNGMPS
jgi:hypothetical protein